jgi:hypothetical protein
VVVDIFLMLWENGRRALGEWEKGVDLKANIL